VKVEEGEEEEEEDDGEEDKYGGKKISKEEERDNIDDFEGYLAYLVEKAKEEGTVDMLPANHARSEGV
jgi:hypothetical protein